jgi:hypothetical protein
MHAVGTKAATALTLIRISIEIKIFLGSQTSEYDPSHRVSESGLSFSPITGKDRRTCRPYALDRWSPNHRSRA